MKQDYTSQKEQVFIAVLHGSVMRFKPKNTLEKQNMYQTSLAYFQIGFRALGKLKIAYKDGSFKLISLSELKLGKQFPIRTRGFVHVELIEAKYKPKP